MSKYVLVARAICGIIQSSIYQFSSNMGIFRSAMHAFIFMGVHEYIGGGPQVQPFYT